MDVVRIDERDSVVVAPTGLHKGQSVRIAGREILVLDAGVLLDGKDIQETAAFLYEKIVQTVNGEYRTRNELNKYFEIGIFKQGITI
ncbi:MAG: hypothetical protein CVU57_30405 [Deltaproteobacteria bacterium HGW-Deltaproteobacteria-15]|jgi:altronate dehydratase|nr:MAG: hypothetical protein CVU57_30405 [Deltaproteobacteria bacterium HGW-Deltaproteobacteria-15]